MSEETSSHTGQPETNPNPSNLSGPSDFLTLIIPRKDYFITPIIILINVLIFILMVASGISFMDPTSEELMKWGADYRPVTVAGEWWRLLTACFVHIGVIHLLMNMYALLSIGYLLEKLMGWRNFLLAYLLTGIASSATSVWWHENTVSAGASGAIFGVYGIFVAMLTTNLIEKQERQAQLQSILIFIGYNLVFGLKGGVDNAAHIGGLISGIILGYGFYYILKNKNNSRLDYGMAGLLTTTVLAYCITICISLIDDSTKYYSEMEKFGKMEEEALAFYKLPEGTEKTAYLKSLNNGMDILKQSITLFDEIAKMDLPDQMKDRNKLLKNYCNLRIKTYKTIYKAIDEGTDKYNQEIEEYNQKIEQSIKDINDFN